MPLPVVPLDSNNEKQHRTVIATAVNELIKVRPPNDRTEAEVAAGVTPTTETYPNIQALSSAFRYIAADQVANILSGNASGQTASVVDDGIQDGFDAYRQATFAAGTYAIAVALTIRPRTLITGAGKSEYVTSLSQTPTGTRIIQTTANFAISTDYTGDPDDSREGYTVIRDLTVLGGTLASHLGTYGISATSTINMTLENVQASAFSLSGFRFSGGLRANLYNCDASYNEDCGIRMDLGDLGSTETSNSYMANIIGGAYHQNKNVGIRLGDSTVKVNIIGVDVESTGNFYPTGDGFGIYLAALARGVNIQGSWFEGNKIHIVVGSTSDTSVVNVPTNTRISDNQFWSTSGGGAKVVLNSGKNTILENNEFFSGGTILLGAKSDNPILRYNAGNPTVTDSNSNTVTVDNKDMTVNNLPYVDLSTWTLTNCTVAEEFVRSPAGMLPVYKVTPAATGNVQLQSTNAAYSWLIARQTIGFYIKSDGTAERDFWLAVASVNMPKSYNSREVDNFKVHNRWQWYSLGRHIDASDTGNQALTLDVTVPTTDAFYITGLSARPGICYDPYRVPENQIGTLTNTATPSVYGLRYAVTGGTTTITDLIGGAYPQVVTIIAEHSLTITDGTNLFLAGSVDIAMNATDTLTLVRKIDGNWYEIGRSDNT